MPTRSENALFAEQTYNMVGKKNKDKRVEKINKNIEKTGFVVDKKHSNRDIVTYVNHDTNEVHVSHRGTDTTGKRTGSDLVRDFNIAIGKTADDDEFKRRTKKTKKALKEHEDKKATGSGHSLGSKSMVTTMATDKYVRDRMEEVHGFNGGATIFGEKEMQKLGKKGKKQMEEKMIHHRTSNDAVSASMLVNPPLGKVKTYKEKKDPDEDQTRRTAETLGSDLTGGDAAAVLNSHGLHHFYRKKHYHDDI